VSASPEKKVQRGEKRRQEEAKERRSIVLYSVIGVLVAVAAAALIVWNSGLLQRNLTALDINGTKYTAADVQYAYNNNYSYWSRNYAFDSSKSVKDQIYDEATGQTWYDYLLDQAVEGLTNNAALAAKANAEGYTLSDEAQKEMDDFLAQLDSTWIGYGYASRDAFIRATFGPYMTYNKLVPLIQQEYLASDYAQTQLDAADHPDADYETYYKEHADELDTVVYSYLTFRAYVSTTDADGNPVEMTDEEKAAQLETLKTEQKALAEEAKAKLEGGAKIEDLAEEYGDELFSSVLSQRVVGANASSYLSDWLLDGSRKTGDITLAENDTSTAFYYYVAVFEGRERDEEPASDVRHILIRAGSGQDPTQEEYDEAEEQAQALLDEWKAGEATEDSFAALATDNTQDTSSASNGGLYSNITSSSSYVDAFKEWVTDPARRVGDTGLVKTEYGWHIMYYSASKDPIWRQTVTSALQEQDLEQLQADASQGWNISRGMGINLVTA